MAKADIKIGQRVIFKHQEFGVVECVVKNITERNYMIEHQYRKFTLEGPDQLLTRKFNVIIGHPELYSSVDVYKKVVLNHKRNQISEYREEIDRLEGHCRDIESGKKHLGFKIYVEGV